MSCRCAVRLLAPRTPQRSRLPWLSPALAPHQQLDAGIAARHQANRKNLKKSKRPFANYFRTEFRCSSFLLPTARTDGSMSSYSVVRLMTDGRCSWNSFWGRAVGGVRTRRKRQDVLEPPAQLFGEDSLDRTIDRLLELRFQWDRGDDILATSLVPYSLYAVTEHCAPFATSVGSSLQGQGWQRQLASGSIELNGERIPLSVFCARGWRKKGSVVLRGKLGFSGIDTVPAIVLDATRGPFVSSPTESLLSLRWKATNREATSVSEMLRLHQKIGRVPVMGLTPRSLLLLLKAHATAEVESPALSVALAIAAAEHYHDYTTTDCLELLRCLRRIAYVKKLSQLPDDTSATFSLYRDATQYQLFFAEFIGDAAPFMVDKVWSRLPEHVRRLTRRKLFLDLTDLLSLALELNGGGLPRNLPNSISSASYVSKYFFLRYTLSLDAVMFTEYADFFSKITIPVASFTTLNIEHKRQEKSKNETDVLVTASETGEIDTTNNNKELFVKPLIMWLCVSFFVRLTAEALGDVLRHVEVSIRRHIQLAREYEEAAAQGENNLRRLSARADLQFYLDRIALARPSCQIYQCIGRRHPRKLRLRLIPFEAFPEIFRHTRLPFEEETRQAHISTARQQNNALSESPLVTVFARSALAEKHIKRACSALDWATMVLTQCTRIVRRIPTPLKRMQRMDASSRLSLLSPELSASGYSEAIDNRSVMCEAIVRTRVQSDIDCLFTHIPWQGLEEQLQTLSEKEEKEIAATMQEKEKSEEIINAQYAHFLDDFLSLSKRTGSGGGNSDVVVSEESVANDTCPILSANSEEKVCKMLESLQENVERFQVVVADFIDAQEEWFLIV